MEQRVELGVGPALSSPGSSSYSNAACEEDSKVCTKHATVFKSHGGGWGLYLQLRCSGGTKILHFPKPSGSAASLGTVHGTLLHSGSK